MLNISGCYYYAEYRFNLNWISDIVVACLCFDICKRAIFQGILSWSCQGGTTRISNIAHEGPMQESCSFKKKKNLTFIASFSVFFYFTFCLFRSFQCICIVYLYQRASSELLVSDINTKNRKIYNDSRLQVLSSGRPQAILRIKNVFTICNCRIKRKSLEC